MKDLILFGMQGSGKGTQGALLAKKYGYTIFDTGSALRAIAKKNSELGQKIRGIIESGKLVSTEIVMEVVADTISRIDSDQAIIFDGIPRSEEQRQQFEVIMNKLHRTPTALYINLSRENAENRLLSRKMCRNCSAIFEADYKKDTCDICGGEIYVRKDDNPTAIKKRIGIFFTETTPVIEYYKEQGRYLEVDGEPSVSEVSVAIEDKINQLNTVN